MPKLDRFFFAHASRLSECFSMPAIVNHLDDNDHLTLNVSFYCSLTLTESSLSLKHNKTKTKHSWSSVTNVSRVCLLKGNWLPMKSANQTYVYICVSRIIDAFSGNCALIVTGNQCASRTRRICKLGGHAGPAKFYRANKTLSSQNWLLFLIKLS